MLPGPAVLRRILVAVASVVAAALVTPGQSAAANPPVCDMKRHLAVSLGFDKDGVLLCRYVANGLTSTTNRCDDPQYRRDPEGIPQSFQVGEWHYNPGTIGMCGLGEFNWYLARDDPARLEYGLKVADWFVRMQRADGTWRYTIDYPVGAMGITLAKPWASSFAQSIGMSLLARAYKHTGRRGYLDAAIKAARPLTIQVGKGGLQRPLFGHPFYEEYPTTPGTFALEGFMTTLMGIYDLRVATPGTHPQRPMLRRLYMQGLSTLQFALPLYDLGTRSAYHLGHLSNPPRPVFAHQQYHSRHIVRLRVLHSITGVRRFLDYANLWQSYDW